VSALMELKGNRAVVTGAASGIGRGVALALARRGCNMALADVNLAGLAKTVEMVKAAAAGEVHVSQHELDVADRAAVADFPRVVLAAHPGVDVLVNNAGVAIGGTFEVASEEDFDWLFEINFFGVVRMTRAFLPLLRNSAEARLVNVSSVFGIISPPEQTAYSASKFAVRGFSNALRHELQGSNVGVTVVHPGGVATSISDNARVPKGVPPEEVARRKAIMKKALRMPPEEAGEIIVRGIERRRARVLVGIDAKLIAFVERTSPVGYWNLLKPALTRK
jgi:NAD(P)-dependent dehydrogenase (short-subunit alcohol dehydrogenase family)